MSLLTDPGVEVREIREACARLLRDQSPPEVARRGASSMLWTKVVDAGWTGLGLPESAGGAGFGLTAQAAMFVEVGRALAPVPLLGTAGMAAPVLAAGGAQELKGVLDGSLTAALVVARGVPPLGTARIHAAAGEPGELRLEGSASAVLDGAVAGLFVVVADSADGLVAGVLSVDAPGLTVTAVDTADVTRPLADLTFTGCVARRLDVEFHALGAALGAAAVALAAEMVGTAAQAFDVTVEYLKTRHQFGKPIGSFQALKHRCADLATDLALANELVFACAAALDDPGELPPDALIGATVMRAADVLARIGAEGVQLHGGIGFTEEADIGLYYRRALATAAALPAPVRQQENLAVLLGL
jgi:alkylation response protein AidB-like acyl-CoA dehydrogenase